MRRNFSMAGVLFVLGLSACGTDDAPLTPEGENPYPVEFSRPDYLLQHSKYLTEELFQIGEHKIWDYNTPNKGFGNVIMIEGDDGIIIVDTTTSHENAMVANDAFRKITNKPVKALIYTHHHADHISGAGAFINAADALSGKVLVIAADNFMREMGDENQVTGPIMGLRASHMYGSSLAGQPEAQDFHISCCGFNISAQDTSFIQPNTFIGEAQELTVAGVKMRIFPTGGESASHIAIYLPDSKVMLSGDEIQGPNYPNLHSLRGTKPRDATKWINALDAMRQFNVDYLVPSHGQPIIGKPEVDKVLTLYRDAIQFTHDQSVRYINKGFTQDELANTIKLPDYLSVEPWTKEMYGTVKHNVREYMVAYISWWNGDPADLDPIPRVEKAQRYVNLMGGRDSVLAAAEKAFNNNDPQWASELTALLVRIDRNDMQSRYLKAAALRTIGYATANTNWRGFYLSGALELEGKIDPNKIQESIAKQLFRPSQYPTQQLLELLRYKIDAENFGAKQLKIAYHFTDTNEDFTLEFRNSILQVHPVKLNDVDVTMTLERSVLDSIFKQELSYADAINNEQITVDGSLLALRSFSKAFDTEPANAYTTLR